MVGYKSTETSVTIPSTYKGLPVTAIGDEAFKNSNVIQVVMPDNVTTIGDDAFYDCIMLASIAFSQNLISIGDLAFCACSGLTNITLPESLTKVGFHAFSYCLDSVFTTENQLCYLPSKNNLYFLLAELASTSLTTVSIRSETKVIAANAFYNCSSLASFAVISGNTSYSTDGKALYDKGQTTLLAYAFESDTSYSVPATVTAIGDMAFYCCRSLTSITLPSSLTSIGYMAFYDCTGLTSITLPSSLTSIGEEAFTSCVGLASLALPASLTAIASRAFYCCTGLTSFAVDSANVNFETDGKALYNKGKTEIVQYAVGLKETTYALPDLLLRIDDGAFAGAAALTGMTLPSSITALGKETFQSCTGLTSITLPASITSIGESAFFFCTGLTSVSLSSSLTIIGDIAFYGCTGLTSITLPASITSIGSKAFASCTKLATMNYNDTKAQWVKVTLGANWNLYCPLLKAVTCTDGSVTL